MATYYAQAADINTNSRYGLDDVTDTEINWAEDLIDKNNGYWVNRNDASGLKYKVSALDSQQTLNLERAVVACIKYARQINDTEFFETPSRTATGNGQTIDALPKFPTDADTYLAEAGLLNHHGYQSYRANHGPNSNWEDIGWTDSIGGY